MADLPSSLKPLLLAGGKSSRMGTPKHLLQLPSGQPLYVHLSRILQTACCQSSLVYISLAPGSAVDDHLELGEIPPKSQASDLQSSISLQILHDDVALGEIGPAAGLLAAHKLDRQATWLVVACDYPLLSDPAISQLLLSYSPPVTCFQNAEGFSEPLLGVWGPEALEILRSNVKNGDFGPSRAIKDAHGKLVRLQNEEWLRNVNTKEEWSGVQSLLEGSMG